MPSSPALVLIGFVHLYVNATAPHIPQSSVGAPGSPAQGELSAQLTEGARNPADAMNGVPTAGK